MRNVTTTEILVLDRQHHLEEAATRYRQRRQLPVAHRAPMRAGAGWMLVRAGLRLADVDRHRSPATLARG